MIGRFAYYIFFLIWKLARALGLVAIPRSVNLSEMQSLTGFQKES